MRIDIDETQLPFFEALASSVRMQVIERLAHGDANIKELVEYVGVSSAIMTSHVKKLEDAGLINTKRSNRKGKVCTLLCGHYLLQLPLRYSSEAAQSYDISIPVGHYTKAEVYPTCGIADEFKVIGAYDDPICFFDTERFNAQLLWFGRGYVEYTVANHVLPSQEILSVELSAELSSEFPHVRDDWPSEISIYLNDVLLYTWLSPGDFGDRRGKLTPNWWPSNQYGLLKHFKVGKEGMFLDGELKSNKTVHDFNLERTQWTIRFESSETTKHFGGLTIYGQKFGDYNQDIIIKIVYDAHSHL